jgi:hypothetical protein
MNIYRDRTIPIEPVTSSARDITINNPAGFAAASKTGGTTSAAFLFTDSRILHWYVDDVDSDDIFCSHCNLTRTTRKNFLELTEISLTEFLANNFLRVRLPGDIIPGTAAFVESGGAGQDVLRIVAATSASLHRLDFEIPSNPVRISVCMLRESLDSWSSDP